MNGIGQIQIIFLFLLLFIVVFGLLARKLGTPYPIVMVGGGLLLGLDQYRGIGDQHFITKAIREMGRL